MELLKEYWIWILLGIAVVWFLARRGARGMGCGMGGHEGHSTSGRLLAGGQDDRASHGSGGREATSAGERRRHGCC